MCNDNGFDDLFEHSDQLMAEQRLPDQNEKASRFQEEVKEMKRQRMIVVFMIYLSISMK